jgi:predicted nucleic acid-binding protein
MIVVADTSPINYLILLDEIELLPALFERVLVPSAVLGELKHPRSPLRVREWTRALPDWTEVCQPRPGMLAGTVDLDTGEREAIQIAMDMGIETILLDDQDARCCAESLQLRVGGTPGVLQRGVRLGKTDLDSVPARLDQTNFRMSPRLREAFLERCRVKR